MAKRATNVIEIGAPAFSASDLSHFFIAFGLCHRGLKLDDRSAVASTTGPDRSSKANANLR